MKRTTTLTILLATGILAGTVACNNLSGLTGDSSLPSGTPDPNSFNTPSGAIAMYNRAIYTFQYAQVGTQSIGDAAAPPYGSNGAFVDYVLTTGLMTDELKAGNLGGSSAAYNMLGRVDPTDSLDARQLYEGGNTLLVYNELQSVRGMASQAIGALAQYVPDSSAALRGQLYALRGYADIMLADLFCSGVPLSTLDYKGDFTYHTGSTSAEVYQHAIAQFDTALTLAPDSVRVMNLARVGRGRALLDLGQYALAAQAVADVPNDFTYEFPVDWTGGRPTPNSIFSLFGTAGTSTGATVADSEGGNGLPYISSNDPRSAVDTAPNPRNQYGQVQYIPVKYGGTHPDVAPITVASGVEARLIEAEAALRSQDYTTWLTKLNTARSLSNGSLPAVSDPGTDSARVSLLFRERAFDLFLTGQRQGDLRRMVRQDHRVQNTVYPTGRYPSPGLVPVYGPAVTAPIPTAEYANPLFTGCFDRGA